MGKKHVECQHHPNLSGLHIQRKSFVGNLAEGSVADSSQSEVGLHLPRMRPLAGP